MNYRDGFFYTTDGLIYGQAGSSPIRECHTITGNIVLSGVIEHFEDFENIESVRGFFYNGADLPRTGDVLPEVDEYFHERGLIQGFPKLREILRDQLYTSAFVDPQEGGFFYDGFGQLEYVGGDYVCAGTETVGQSLVEVEGVLRCDNSRLENLEAVEQMTLDGVPLPSLVWAGALQMPNTVEGRSLVLPNLREVGEGYDPVGINPLPPGLGAAGRFVHEVDLSSLERVTGTLSVQGLGSSSIDTAWYEGRGQELKYDLAHVDVTGAKRICSNGPDDPCPGDETCDDVFGPGSVWCCELTWPECLALYGEPDAC